ncbi:MAG: DNA methylase, partial [Aquificaceae bacterium]
QKLALITFTEKVRQAYKKMVDEGYDKEYAKAVVTYLALGVDRVADRNSSLSVWNNIAEKQEHTFGRQALPMVWDYAETNVIFGVQGWERQFTYIINTLENLPLNIMSATITQTSATELPYPDNFFDAVFTDPPYYDNVPYSYLSDFFYVWLKRSIGDLYPDLFVTPLTPKSKEIV